MPEKSSEIATTQRDQQRDQHLGRRDQYFASPFRLLDHFADEVDRMFADFGLGRSSNYRTSKSSDRAAWMPQVEMSQRNHELVVRADLPGLGKDDVKVDVTDDAITIQGERRHDHEEEHGGTYRTERSYGSFYRTIPLPEGAITDQAKATFKDGVLEITMPAPPEQVRRGRRLEITEGLPKTK
ncbi:MAG TPA: Hsp20/alpha crystallin family protein [Vicinamibacterales bacterium]|jgi:HSP20 family protein